MTVWFEIRRKLNPKKQPWEGEEMNPAELASWTLMASFLTANATYFVGGIIAVWLGFRISYNIYAGEGTPLLARLLATAYSLCATFYMYSTLSQQVRTVTDFANGFAAASQTQELSAAAQRMAAFDGTVPSIVNTVFVVAIIIFQLAGIWMKRDSA
jgi:hypothetical protein